MPVRSAPALGSRSPPKNPSPSRDTQDHNENNDDEDEPALSRFARIKREATRDFSNRPGGPKVITSPPKPDKWTVKDTSVNIATAFIQAAGEDMSTSYNSNNAWASTSRTSLPVPRSTSVEYEAAAPQTANRRLPPPPDKFNRSTLARKPLSKTSSLRHVPDSEGEEEQSSANVRGRSPFEQGLSLAKQALGAAAYYVRQRSREPEEPSMERPQPSVNGSANGNDSSYDYVAEEQAFQAHRRSTAAARRNRMSVDNKAYKPPQDSEEESEWSDGGKTKRRKRKFKKGPAGGPLSTLPVVSADKRRRRKGHGSTGNIFEEDDESESEDNTQADNVRSGSLLRHNSLLKLFKFSRNQITWVFLYQILAFYPHDYHKNHHSTMWMIRCYLPNKDCNPSPKLMRIASQPQLPSPPHSNIMSPLNLAKQVRDVAHGHEHLLRATHFQGFPLAVCWAASSILPSNSLYGSSLAFCHSLAWSLLFVDKFLERPTI
jgi:hypothetical protein